MLSKYSVHNLFKDNLKTFILNDPHLSALNELKYQHRSTWWQDLHMHEPGIYILTGGRQVGKSTSCKLLIQHCLQKKFFDAEQIFYLPCDEIYDAKELAHILRTFLSSLSKFPFLLIIDEITFINHWERAIKALADEGSFKRGLCLLTGSDSLILREAAMSFPGRRGKATKIDFHLYPLTFPDYVTLITSKKNLSSESLLKLFRDYLHCGGYLRAINDLAAYNEITTATYLTYEQWIRGDFLKHGKNEDYLLSILKALFTIGVSPISYSSLTQKIGLMSKETCIDYSRMLERMDILINLQVFDQNKKQGFPRKDRKFHFMDPFIQNTIYHWLKREGYLNDMHYEASLVEACVASHCYRYGKIYYFKGLGEIDIIWLRKNSIKAIEVKWANQLRPNDLKMLRQFKDTLILGKTPASGHIENIKTMSVYDFLVQLL